MILVYTGLLTIAPAWWFFTRGFSRLSGYRKVAFRSGLPALVTINALLWIGLVTNPWHGQFIETRAFARSEYGPLWYCTAFVNYAALVTAMLVHARESLHLSDPTIRSQCRYLVAAGAIPTLMNMIYVFSPTPLAYDPTALGFSLSCVTFWFAVERRNLFFLERVSLPSVLDNDADPILIVSPDYHLLYSNPKAMALFGSADLKPGVELSELIADRLPTFSFETAIDDPLVGVATEHRFSSPTGDDRWVTVEVSTVERQRGIAAGQCLRIRDRTALRDAQDDAQHNFALLEALNGAIGEGVLIKDARGEIRYINDAFARLWKATSKEMLEQGHGLQKFLEKMLVEAPPKSMQRMWHTSIETFDPVTAELCDVTLLDGRVVEVRTFPVDTNQGFVGRAWRLRDVTQARSESQAMIQSQKVEGLGVLAGGIAHDFNNLLMAILGNTEIVRQSVETDSPVYAPLVDVEAAATSAAELTSQLLAYAGKTTFLKESLDLSALIREVTSLISVSIPKNVEINYALTENLPLIRGGPAQLRQVMMNLITNAADAIGDRKGTITISTGLGPPPTTSNANAKFEHGKTLGTMVHMAVQDDGSGMESEILTKIFDPFFTTKFTGRGLGLAATRGILESHNGSLRIETSKDRGSTFTVMFPVEELADPSVESIHIKEEKKRIQGRRVLVVDDEPAIQKILTKHLESAGLEVHIASNGEAAIRAVDEISPALDLVILDISMPGLSGVETRKRLREKRPDLPIIISSGHPEESIDRLEGWQADLDGFIQKPYRNKSLMSAIERLLAATNPGDPDNWRQVR